MRILNKVLFKLRLQKKDEGKGSKYTHLLEENGVLYTLFHEITFTLHCFLHYNVKFIIFFIVYLQMLENYFLPCGWL